VRETREEAASEDCSAIASPAGDELNDFFREIRAFADFERRSSAPLSPP
jgi:hypothetical protein